MVRALGVRPADVEDVVQATFVALWGHLGDFDPNHSFSAWSYAIAANKARDWVRHARRRAAWFSASPLDTPEALSAADPAFPEARLVGRAEIQRLELALADLPEKLRLPLVLSAVTDMTHPEIASTLGVSSKTVEMRIARARAKLRQRIGGPPRSIRDE